MLDVARHFFGVEEIKRYIDLISHYKINRLHLHLSDDQGWRIQIKSWLRLTEVGGSAQVGGGRGGYYTQEQYKDIVEYARSRYVTIVPEIDTPSHTNAALASPAVGPPGNPVEMSSNGRTLSDIGRKLLSLRPLRTQIVSRGDSVLGSDVSPTGRGINASGGPAEGGSIVTV